MGYIYPGRIYVYHFKLWITKKKKKKKERKKKTTQTNIKIDSLMGKCNLNKQIFSARKKRQITCKGMISRYCFSLANIDARKQAVIVLDYWKKKKKKKHPQFWILHLNEPSFTDKIKYSWIINIKKSLSLAEHHYNNHQRLCFTKKNKPKLKLVAFS